MPNCHPADLPGPSNALREALGRLKDPEMGIPAWTPEAVLRTLIYYVWTGAFHQGLDDGRDSILAVLHREATLAALPAFCGTCLSMEEADIAVRGALLVGDAFTAALKARLPKSEGK